MHRRLVYIYLLNVLSFSSRYFNKIKRTSRLGRLLALSLEILWVLLVRITKNTKIQTLQSLIMYILCDLGIFLPVRVRFSYIGVGTCENKDSNVLHVLRETWQDCV